MPHPPDHIVCHDITDRPYHKPCHARQAIPYTCHPAKPHRMQSHTSPGNTMPCPQGHTIYHVPCRARQAILYTMPCPLSHCINHAMPARPYHIPCHAFQAKPYTMPGMTSHTIYHAIPDWPHQMPCPPTITIYHNMSTRLYHNNAIYYAMPTRPYQLPCHTRQTTSYVMT